MLRCNDSLKKKSSYLIRRAAGVEATCTGIEIVRHYNGCQSCQWRSETLVMVAEGEVTQTKRGTMSLVEECRLTEDGPAQISYVSSE